MPRLWHKNNRVSLIFIRFYQRLISPLLPARCRFYPSCSSYAYETFAHQGFLTALAKSLWRFLRCHPWHPGGVDFPKR